MASAEIDASCAAHIKSTGMTVKKYKKIGDFVDQILAKSPSEDALLKKFANKCYNSFDEKEARRQAGKFLRVLYGKDLKLLIEQGTVSALKATAAKSANIMRIVRLNKPDGVFTKKLDHYLIGDNLGKGGTSVVKRGRNLEDGKEVAVKILDPSKEFAPDLKQEIEILKSLKHDNIIRLYDCFDEVVEGGNRKETTTVIILELANQGELFDFFMYTGKFEAPLARWFFKQMIAGLEYCHNKGVAHRDLKPENVLLGDGYKIKLVDFGFASRFVGESGQASKMLTALGTPGYAAPEILRREKYTENVDIFSLGVILFICLTGFPPFQEAKESEDWWFDKLKKKKFALFWQAHERTAKFTPEAKELIIGMLAANPTERWSISKIKSCKWYNQDCLTQEKAVKSLKGRKSKVEKDKINEGKKVPNGVVNRGDSTIHAPMLGNYKPPNAFYCVPGVCADDIRAEILDTIEKMAMGAVKREYLGTGDDTVPERPEDLDEKEQWAPWYDLNFSCELVERKTEESTRQTKYKFEGSVYIREDPEYTPPEGKPDFVRNIVYFKRWRGLFHKWIVVMFKIQKKVGYLHIANAGHMKASSAVAPKASPVARIGEGPVALSG